VGLKSSTAFLRRDIRDDTLSTGVRAQVFNRMTCLESGKGTGCYRYSFWLLPPIVCGLLREVSVPGDFRLGFEMNISAFLWHILPLTHLRFHNPYHGISPSTLLVNFSHRHTLLVAGLRDVDSIALYHKGSWRNGCSQWEDVQHQLLYLVHLNFFGTAMQENNMLCFFRDRLHLRH